MKFLTFIFVILITATSTFADDPPATKPSSHPKGEVSKHPFNQSVIFPGTTREYWVYVPKQYDPAKPACLYVCQDGLQYNAPSVFDRLIDEKEMPVTIGIFVNPGVVKPQSKDALERNNRSFEYDSLGDAYARFLIDELIPHIVKEQKLNLSPDPNDHCIAGASSGGICAFTAAWERPDYFRRVFSCVGSFTALHGGFVYPTLIRKYESKPIRVFLEDGKNDLNHVYGDWWFANQEMERSLTFAGYEVQHNWGDGQHSAKHGGEVFPEAMKFLWKDWPKPVKAGQGTPQYRDIFIADESWKSADEKVTTTSMTLTTHAKNTYALQDGKVVFTSEKGESKAINTDGIKSPAALAVSPDRSLLYVADAHSHWMYSYQIQKDGEPFHKQKYFQLFVPETSDDPAITALATDVKGHVYAATAMGVQVCDAIGRVICIIPLPGNVAATGLCIGGEKNSTLFVAAGEKVFKRPLKVEGVGPANAPTKPGAPKL